MLEVERSRSPEFGIEDITGRDAGAVRRSGHRGRLGRAPTAASSLAGRTSSRFTVGMQAGTPGRRGDGASFTVDSFSRYMVHDPVHHLFDVTGSAAADGPLRLSDSGRDLCSARPERCRGSWPGYGTRIVNHTAVPPCPSVADSPIVGDAATIIRPLPVGSIDPSWRGTGNSSEASRTSTAISPTTTGDDTSKGSRRVHTRLVVSSEVMRTRSTISAGGDPRTSPTKLRATEPILESVKLSGLGHRDGESMTRLRSHFVNGGRQKSLLATAFPGAPIRPDPWPPRHPDSQLAFAGEAEPFDRRREGRHTSSGRLRSVPRTMLGQSIGKNRICTILRSLWQRGASLSPGAIDPPTFPSGIHIPKRFTRGVETGAIGSVDGGRPVAVPRLHRLEDGLLIAADGRGELNGLWGDRPSSWLRFPPQAPAPGRVWQTSRCFHRPSPVPQVAA